MSRTGEFYISLEEERTLKAWQIDLLLDALDLMQDLLKNEEDEGEPDPIALTRRTLEALRQESVR